MKYIIEKIYPRSAFRLFFFITLISFGCLALLFLIISPFLHIFLWGLLIFFCGVPIVALLFGFFAYINSITYSHFAKIFRGISLELKQDKD